MVGRARVVVGGPIAGRDCVATIRQGIAHQGCTTTCAPAASAIPPGAAGSANCIVRARDIGGIRLVERATRSLRFVDPARCETLAEDCDAFVRAEGLLFRFGSLGILIIELEDIIRPHLLFDKVALQFAKRSLLPTLFIVHRLQGINLLSLPTIDGAKLVFCPSLFIGNGAPSIDLFRSLIIEWADTTPSILHRRVAGGTGCDPKLWGDVFLDLGHYGTVNPVNWPL